MKHRCKHHATYQRACQAAEEKFFSTGYTGGHRSRAPVQRHDSCKGEKQHRLNQRQDTGLTGDSRVSCQKANGYYKAVSDRLHRCPITGLSGALRRKGQTTLNGSMVLDAYIYAIPWSLEDCWSYYKSHTHPENPPSLPKCILIKSLGLALALRV